LTNSLESFLAALLVYLKWIMNMGINPQNIQLGS